MFKCTIVIEIYILHYRFLSMAQLFNNLANLSYSCNFLLIFCQSRISIFFQNPQLKKH